MKKIGLLLFLACGFALTSCEEDKTLDETRVTSVTDPTTTLEVSVNKYEATFTVSLTDGNPAALECGVMLSESPEVTLENSTSYSVDENGQLTLMLSPGTTYYACAYALTTNKLVVSEAQEFTMESHPLVKYLGAKTFTGIDLFTGDENPVSVTISPDSNDESVAYISGIASSQTGSPLGQIKLVFDVENGTCTIPAGQIVEEPTLGNYQYGLFEYGSAGLNYDLEADIVGVLGDGTIDFGNIGALILEGGDAAGYSHMLYMYASIY